MRKKTVLLIIVDMICFVAFNHKILFRNNNYIKNVKSVGKNSITLSIKETKQLQNLTVDAVEKADEIASKTGIKNKIYEFLSDLYN